MMVRRLVAGDETVLAHVAPRDPAPAEAGSFLEDPRCLAWVVESAGSVVGWCWAHELNRPDGRCDLLVYELEILEGARRRGHGRALLDAVLLDAEREGYGKVWLLTDSDNAAAQALYGAAGGARRTQLLYSWPMGSRGGSRSIAK